MVCNVGTLDRVVRALVAVVLIGGALYFAPLNVYKTPILFLAMLFVLSASFGVCYVYRLFGMSTRAEDK